MFDLLNKMNGNLYKKCGNEKYTTEVLSMQEQFVKMFPGKIEDTIANGINSPNEYPNLSNYSTSAPSQEAFNAYAESLISLQNSLGTVSVNSASIQR